MRKKYLLQKIVLCFISIISICQSAPAQSTTEYDIVLTGGRVIDPETKLDAIRNVGIINNHIAQISMEPLKGKQEINASGLVVAPGFIDLHIHGRTNKEQEYQLHDGLTTALELEWGIENLISSYCKCRCVASVYKLSHRVETRCYKIVSSLRLCKLAENFK